MSYPYHMRLWDSAQHQAATRKLERARRDAVAKILAERKAKNSNHEGKK